MHSSWRGVVTALASPLILILIGGLTAATRGAHPISIAIFIAGVALLVGSMLDFPWSTAFTGDGIERRCPLRRHRLPWSDIDRITRTSGSWIRRSPGGLVAARGRRRYLLCDQPESRDEYDALLQQMLAWRLEVDVSAARPPERIPPTWLYRRRRTRY